MEETSSAIAPRINTLIIRKISISQWMLLITILILGPVLAIMLILLNTIWLACSTDEDSVV